MPRITNDDEARAYFKTQTGEGCCILSCRAALRVAANLAHVEGDAFGDIALATFRAMITSAGRGLGRPADVNWLESYAAAASAANSAALSAASAANSAALSAADSAAAAASADDSAASALLSASSATYSALSASAAASSGASALLSALSADTEIGASDGAAWHHFERRPVWQSFDGVEHMEAAHEAFLKRLALSSDWNWWCQWYEQMWHGTFTDWDFALDIAKIDWDAPKGESVWDKGPAAVAARIEELRRLRATDVTPRLAQRADGKWDVDDETIPAEPLEFAVGQVELALSTALKLCSPNLFNEQSDEAVIISDALDRYRNNHSLLAVRFYEASMSFNERIGTEYPENDSHLVGLQNALFTSVEEMCSHNETIRDRVGRVAVLNVRRAPDDEDREQLRELPAATQDLLTERAQGELESAVEQVLASDTPPRSLRARLANWTITLGRGVDAGQKNDKRAQWLLGLGRRLMSWFFGDEDLPGSE